MPATERIAAVALVLALGASAGAAQKPDFKLKPGASGKVCLSCHVDFAERIAQPFVHTPVKAGDCTDCHSPHAADHGKLLETDADAMCTQCHAGLVPHDALSAHAPAAEGRCVQCHDPHASAFEAVLREQGNSLCLGCHQELAGASTVAHPHRPVGQDCLGCHDAHASKQAGHLLVQRSPELCLSCHATNQPSAVRGHVGYPVDRSDCTSCHDPHGSANEGILWASVHAPIGRRMCSQCHLEPGSPSALDLKRSGTDLCRGCHSELFDEARGKNTVHWPFVDGRGCESCHRPHASGTAKLLAAPEDEMCGSCHADVIRRQERSVTKHPPVEAGECSTCHEAHAADTAFLLVGANDFELCGTCHDWEKHSAHPIGDKVVDQRNRNLTLDCASCHRTHGSPHQHLTHFEHKMELCVQCHADLAR